MKPEEGGNGESKDVYVTDGDYIRDIEINDLRNRYTLTKGSTQQMVNYSCNRPTDTPDMLHAPRSRMAIHYTLSL